MKSKTIYAILLLSGNCIGAGMLALPAVMAGAGLLFASTAILLTWFFMFLTGLLFLQTTLWMKEEVNLLSIAKRYLGQSGAALSGFFFLFLYISLLVAYFAAITSLVSKNLSVSEPLVLSAVALCFFFLIFLGLNIAKKINFLLMAGLFVSFSLMLLLGAISSDASSLTFEGSPLVATLSLPILFGAFGYHNIVPTLASYTNYNQKTLFRVLFFGTIIPLVLYLIWVVFTLALLPEELLLEAKTAGAPVASFFQHRLVGILALFFSLFAITTSIIGVLLSLVDFLGDALSIKKREGASRFFLTLFSLAPPFFITLSYPQIFYTALSIAGGIGEAVLNGLIPIFAAARGVYTFKEKPFSKMLVHKTTLSLLVLFTFIVLFIELATLLTTRAQ